MRLTIFPVLAAGLFLASTHAHAEQGFCVLPNGLTRIAQSEADCQTQEQFVQFEGQPGAVGPAGEDGTSCSVAQGADNATISCTDGTMATVEDGADGAEGPSGPAGPEGPPGDAAVLCEGFALNDLATPAGLDCPAVPACPCFGEAEILASGATECKQVHFVDALNLIGSTTWSTVGGTEDYEAQTIGNLDTSVWSCSGSDTTPGATSNEAFDVCVSLIEDTLGPCTVEDVSP